MDTLYDKGKQAFEAKDWNLAIECLSPLCDNEQKDYYPFYAVGRSYAELYQYKEALNYYKSALLHKNNDIQVLKDISFCFYAVGEYDDAINICLDMEQKSVSSNYIHYIKALCYYKRNQFKNIIDVLDIQNNNYGSELSYVYALAGYAFSKLKRYKDSIMMHQKRLEHDPKCCTALLGISLSYRRLFKFRKSLEYLDRALEINPKDKRAIAYKIGMSLYLLRFRDVINYMKLFRTVVNDEMKQNNEIKI